MYGQEINLTYKGDHNFKTTPGAIATLCVCTVLLSYAIYRSVILFNRINPETNKNSLMRDLDHAGPLMPGLLGFDFAFGIGQPLDPSYGSYIAEEVTAYYDKPNEKGVFVKKKAKRNLAFTTCLDQHFSYKN